MEETQIALFPSIAKASRVFILSPSGSCLQLLQQKGTGARQKWCEQRSLIKQAGCEGIRRHLSSSYCFRLFILKEKKKTKHPAVYHSSVSFELHVNTDSIKQSSFRGRNSRLCIFFEPSTLFNHPPLPIQFPSTLKRYPFQQISDAFLVPQMILQNVTYTSKCVGPQKLSMEPQAPLHRSIPTEQQSEQQRLQNRRVKCLVMLTCYTYQRSELLLRM